VSTSRERASADQGPLPVGGRPTRTAPTIAAVDLVAALREDQVHADNIARALAWLTERLDAAGIPFALIGGLALRHYGHVRYTEDIDILTTPDGLDRIHSELVGLGLTPRFRGARKWLRHAADRVNIDVIVAGEPAGAVGGPVVFPDPRSDEFVEEGGLRIPKLPTLVSFKLASGIFGSRTQDIADVEALIRINALDESFASQLPEPLRAAFVEAVERTHRARRARPEE